MSKKSVIIMGAGPAGLTAAYEILKKASDRFEVTVLERDSHYVGGIARTVKYKGYRFDIGGHRFFSKNQEIEDLWQEVLGEDFITRPRLSRWYFRGKFFSYPIKPLEILRVFGLVDSTRIVLSYLRSKLFPIKPEKNLEDYYINQFGRFLAYPFFIDYNDKLWGVKCRELSTDFAKQRVKGLSFTSAITAYFKKLLKLEKRGEVKTLIDEFRYPKYGPGMMWERFRQIVESRGGRVIMGSEVVSIKHSGGKVRSVVVQKVDGGQEEINGDYFFSTIPLSLAVQMLSPAPPAEVLGAAKQLTFRDFITVALIIDRRNIFPDNWIYTHDPGMRPIRIQNFNNWSPYLVTNERETVLGFEYVCTVGDELWSMSDDEILGQAKDDLEKTGFARASEVIDGKTVRLRHVYPVYTLGYEEKVNTIRNYLVSSVKNLFPIGRGGMHRYNNSDHSMMTALLAVRNLIDGKDYNVWQVNADAEYHEEKQK